MSENQQVVALPSAVLPPQNVQRVSPLEAKSPPMERLDKHRRLRRAIAAKEATLLAITRLIGARHNAGGAAFTKTTTATTDSPTINSCLEVENARGLQFIAEHRLLKGVEAAHAKERALLEKLIYDLRWELEAAGNTLRNQTEAMKFMGIGMSRMGPHRIVKMQREQQSKAPLPFGSEHETAESVQRELENVRERVKGLENLLAEREAQCNSAQKRAVETQTELLGSSFKKTNRETVTHKKRGENSLIDVCAEKSSGVACNVTSDQCLSRGATSNPKVNVDAACGMEGTYLTASRTWRAKEKEFKGYIRILENTITRMERLMPCEKPNKALLFNMKLGLVSCEKLLNRRNNGVELIDPFVVVYGLTGEKALETLPQDDTDCPQFSETEDTVTLKVARRTPWNIVIEVYSRGSNDARLFLGQAKIPAGPLLENAITTKGATRHSVKLFQRERETDEEILRNANNLGVVIFDVSATIVGATDTKKTQQDGNTLLETIDQKEIFKQDDENELSRDICASKAQCSSSCHVHAQCFSLRVAGVRGISKLGSRPNCSPYVVAYDSCSGEELLRTMPALKLKGGFLWENNDMSATTITVLEQNGSIIFHVYDRTQDGKDYFIGKASFTKDLLHLEKEWHKLKIDFFAGDSSFSLKGEHGGCSELLLQCTRMGLCNKKKEPEKKSKTLGLSHSFFRGTFFDSLWSSKILNEDTEDACNKLLIPSFDIRVCVEACRGLCAQKETEGGVTFVRVVAPDSKIFVTSTVPYAQNLSWNKEDGFVTMMALHPLDTSVIQFHVILNENNSGGKEILLGYAQLAVVELFCRGFGRKELQLGIKPQGNDESFCQHAADVVGSIVLSFAVVTSSSQMQAQNNNGNEGVAVECEATDSKIGVSMNDKKFSSTLSATATAATALPLMKTDDSACSKPLLMRIYVKGGNDLLDCDQMMFNVLGATDPRVMVWVGSEHVFTLPEKRDTVNPKWNSEEGEFFISVHLNEVIRFEVQDVDVSGFDSMGCATILASEVFASPGEHRLPVMHFGKQYGTLDVLFTIEKN